MTDPTAEANISDHSSTAIAAQRPFRPLRAWPALSLAALMVASRFGPALFEDAAVKYWMVSIFGPLLCCLLLIIWWLAASRATWRERLFGFLSSTVGSEAWNSRDLKSRPH